jgi:hypothetical protein
MNIGVTRNLGDGNLNDGAALSTAPRGSHEADDADVDAAFDFLDDEHVDDDDEEGDDAEPDQQEAKLHDSEQKCTYALSSFYHIDSNSQLFVRSGSIVTSTVGKDLIASVLSGSYCLWS